MARQLCEFTLWLCWKHVVKYLDLGLSLPLGTRSGGPMYAMAVNSLAAQGGGRHLGAAPSALHLWVGQEEWGWGEAPGDIPEPGLAQLQRQQL